MVSESMGKFTAISMRETVTYPAIVVNTCGKNDSSEEGDAQNWVWANPTNRRFPARFKGTTAVSVECLWQGLKVFGVTQGGPDPKTLEGDWRRGKAQRPIGHFNESAPLITDPGTARREIYIPAYSRQIESWLSGSPHLLIMLAKLQQQNLPVLLRDFDTGRGIDRAGPMSHAWVLAVYLNTGKWPN